MKYKKLLMVSFVAIGTLFSCSDLPSSSSSTSDSSTSQEDTSSSSSNDTSMEEPVDGWNIIDSSNHKLPYYYFGEDDHFNTITNSSEQSAQLNGFEMRCITLYGDNFSYGSVIEYQDLLVDKGWYEYDYEDASYGKGYSYFFDDGVTVDIINIKVYDDDYNVIRDDNTLGSIIEFRLDVEYCSTAFPESELKENLLEIGLNDVDFDNVFDKGLYYSWALVSGEYDSKPFIEIGIYFDSSSSAMKDIGSSLVEKKYRVAYESDEIAYYVSEDEICRVNLNLSSFTSNDTSLCIAKIYHVQPSY